MGAPATTCAPWAVAMVPWAHSSEATDCTDDLHGSSRGTSIQHDIRDSPPTTYTSLPPTDPAFIPSLLADAQGMHSEWKGAQGKGGTGAH
eukprot:CAMPEP_0119538312 /NCGR_PEP_ID=MMETSP1344-20130328/50762_1 /TAXON_ID=236787 /ORGANISM="Florenciella parvula, Strain CCMP2471" /LENGTH=89 /DNA_ID=CAMNT_0007581141 /DNA_START=106 /DNA_END=373 /DNA_ORIENTATION=-